MMSCMQSQYGDSTMFAWWRSMDYTDRITDCFYDVWGNFDAEIGGMNIFPSITALLALSPSDGDKREVMMVAVRLAL